jgi:hypothetical protein
MPQGVSRSTRSKPRRVPTDGRYVRYSLQWKTCGKRNCICHTDKSKRHGPYWHAYWTDDQGRHVGCHVGAELPDGVEVKRKRGSPTGLTAKIVLLSTTVIGLAS